MNLPIVTLVVAASLSALVGCSTGGAQGGAQVSQQTQGGRVRSTGDDRPGHKLTGGSTAPSYTSIVAPSGFGEIRVTYTNGTAAGHPTEWILDGGTPTAVGSQAVEVGAFLHRVEFNALNSNDTPPQPIDVPVKVGKRTRIQVFYQ